MRNAAAAAAVLVGLCCPWGAAAGWFDCPERPVPRRVKKLSHPEPWTVAHFNATALAFEDPDMLIYKVPRPYARYEFDIKMYHGGGLTHCDGWAPAVVGPHKPWKKLPALGITRCVTNPAVSFQIDRRGDQTRVGVVWDTDWPPADERGGRYLEGLRLGDEDGDGDGGGVERRSPRGPGGPGRAGLKKRLVPVAPGAAGGGEARYAVEEYDPAANETAGAGPKVARGAGEGGGGGGDGGDDDDDDDDDDGEYCWDLDGDGLCGLGVVKGEWVLEEFFVEPGETEFEIEMYTGHHAFVMSTLSWPF